MSSKCISICYAAIGLAEKMPTGKARIRARIQFRL